MGTPGSVRQRNYRLKHPQLNATFRDHHEYNVVERACWFTGYSPREALVNWAEKFFADLQAEVAGKPNVDDSSGC